MRKVEVVTELMDLHGGVLVIIVLKHAHPAVDVPIVNKIRRPIVRDQQAAIERFGKL